MLLKYYERYQNLTISSWLRVDNFVYRCIRCFIAADVLMSNTRTSAEKIIIIIIIIIILIQLSLFYIDVAQNKTKQKLKNKKKKSIFQTIEVLKDLSKLKSDFLCFNTFLCKKTKQNKKKLTFLCFSTCIINIMLQYLRQLHNLSNFLSWVISPQTSIERRWNEFGFKDL